MKAGDLVHPRHYEHVTMVVLHVDYLDVKCYWFDKCGAYHEELFVESQLSLVEPKTPETIPSPAPVPTQELAPKRKRGASASGLTQCPLDWQPSDEDLRIALSLGVPDAMVVAQQMIDWSAENPVRNRKANWSATFRNWCRRRAEKLRDDARKAQNYALSRSGHSVTDEDRYTQKLAEQKERTARLAQMGKS